MNTEPVPASDTVQPNESSPATDYNVIDRRIAAFFLDVVLWLPIFVISAQHFGRVETANGSYMVYLNNVPFAVYLLAWLIYYIVLEWLFGGTLGKLVVGIRVKSENGRKLTLVQSLVRNVLRIIDGFPYIIPNLVGIVVASTSDKKQRIGDKTAHVVVVKTDKPEPASRKALSTLLLLIIAGIIVIVTVPASKKATTGNVPSARSNNSSSSSSVPPEQAARALQVSNEAVGYIVSNNAQALYRIASPQLKAQSTEAQLATGVLQINQYLTSKPVLLSNQPPATTSPVIYVYSAQTTIGQKSLVMTLDYVNGEWLVTGANLQVNAH